MILNSYLALLTDVLGKIKKKLHSHIVRESLLTGVVQVARAFVALLLTAFLSRHLSQEVFGQYQLILSYLGVATIFNLPGMSTALQRAILNDADAFINKSLSISLATSVAGALGLFVVGQVINSYNAELGFALTVTAILLPIGGLDKFDTILLGRQRFIASRVIALGNGLLQMALIGCTAWLTKDLQCILVAFFVSRILSVLIGWLFARKLRHSRSADPAFMKELITQGWKLSLLGVLGQCLNYVDQIIIGSLDPSALALFHIGGLLPRRIREQLKGILVVPICCWATESAASNIRKIKDNAINLFLIGIALVVGLYFVLPYCIPMLFSEKYTEAIWIGQWLSLILVLNPFTVVVWSYDQYQSNGMHYAKQITFVRVFTLGLQFVVIPIYHLEGAVACMLARETVSFALAVWLLRHYLNSTTSKIN
ncbi:oligosaccharide flippase family protein [Desulfobaculum sp. SPO524]|uniref:oligosaccharide flippase family protein n=1 Tax=Desulfobaculum sp. SPO524 TaxID=3378071 RepID=UPI003854928D